MWRWTNQDPTLTSWFSLPQPSWSECSRLTLCFGQTLHFTKKKSFTRKFMCAELFYASKLSVSMTDYWLHTCTCTYTCRYSIIYVTGYIKTRLMENNNFKQMLAFNRSVFSHFMSKANTIWWPGRTIVDLPGYQIRLASYTKSPNSKRLFKIIIAWFSYSQSHMLTG